MYFCCTKTGKLRSGEYGGVSIISLTIVLAIFLLSSSYLYLAQADLRMTTRQIQAKQALYLAEAGIEMARCELANNPNWKPQTQYGLSTGTFSITVSKAGSIYTVGSTGKAGEAIKKLSVSLQSDGSGGLKVISYSEVFS